MEKAYEAEIKKLGLRIKKLREGANMSQQELADKCEIDIRTIQRIEKGEYGFGLHILFALAEALKTQPYELLKGLNLS